MSEFIPNRGDGKEFHHPSELGPTLDPEILSIVEGEHTEDSRRALGRTAIGVTVGVAGAVAMYTLNHFTEMGYNPLNYAVPINLYFNR